MAIYKISPYAEQDLIDIYLRGLNKWGEKQADEFQLRIVSAFHTLVGNQDLGRSTSIRPQLQRYELSPYVIFYRKFSYGIRIARLLYKSRAMEKHL
ncbi:type II toxin-antitoxin system RelE/ParE family toxin [sulfur-oxidizing endosymbiont of Gigantopelta aegis]|uniref:type II toxin-antitoxin system RelE/ParE family toxin n=1 Tax=sulfur-oxidizing endosymbiont of Gigantopelta aegis TaxID=2794934 RepID=UPI0018DBA36E|nr:type II toxin-antitoxin system RelE/ParE family toxin [sulfur-oxidizing endosymbiont of Gigantopelta aegis]